MIERRGLSLKRKSFTSFIVLLLFLVILPSAKFAENKISGYSNWSNPHIVDQTEKVFQAANVEKVVTVNNLGDLEHAMYSKLQNYTANFTISYQGNTNQLKTEIRSIFEQIFEQDPYLGGTISQWAFKYSGYVNDVTIDFSVQYLTNNKQEVFVNQEVERILETLIDSDMTEFEKVKAVNDYIVLNTKYSENTKASPHSVYAILTEKKGVCQGYALLAYKMLNKLGFDVYYVTGTAGGIGHAWNLVKVDGKWYQLDTTWNDPVPDRKSQVSYQYFLVTDKQLSKNHEWDRAKYPATTSDDFSSIHNTSSTFVVDVSKYNVWKEQQTNDVKKAWRIEFNSSLNKETVNEKSVYVIDNEGKKVSFILPVVEQDKYIRIQNNGQFAMNALYYIVIEKDVASMKGNKMKKGMYIPFIVK